LAVWSIVNFSELKSDTRLDAEYYQPLFLKFESLLSRTGFPIVNLGSLVIEGYRVVYENTNILEEEFNPECHVKFLQATNILNGFPVIEKSSMGWVNRSDWDRYTQGRMKPGEILIEVKGKAEKVAIVPDDSLDEILVTGTLYKMMIDENKIDRNYVFVYLLSKLGCSFRDRGKTNTLISYVNKDDLYSIPIPIVPSTVQIDVKKDYQKAYESYKHSQSLYAEAEALLLNELGLDTLDLSTQKTYVANFSETVEGDRFDAEYFQPKYYRVLDALKSLNPKRIVPLEELLEDITNGQTPLHHNLSQGDVTFLTAEHILDFRINFDSEKRILSKHHETQLKKTQLKEKDILITIKGRIGNAAVVEGLSKPVNINQDVGLLRLKEEYHPYYVSGFINSSAGKELTGQIGTGQINPFLGLGKLKKIMIPIYDEDYMNEIGKKVEQKVREAFQKAEEAENLLEQAKLRVEEMILG
jgi:type I restriction enzyme, S subunit